MFIAFYSSVSIPFAFNFVWHHPYIDPSFLRLSLPSPCHAARTDIMWHDMSPVHINCMMVKAKHYTRYSHLLCWFSAPCFQLYMPTYILNECYIVVIYVADVQRSRCLWWICCCFRVTFKSMLSICTQNTVEVILTILKHPFCWLWSCEHLLYCILRNLWHFIAYQNVLSEDTTFLWTKWMNIQAAVCFP